MSREEALPASQPHLRAPVVFVLPSRHPVGMIARDGIHCLPSFLTLELASASLGLNGPPIDALGPIPLEAVEVISSVLVDRDMLPDPVQARHATFFSLFL